MRLILAYENSEKYEQKAAENKKVGSIPSKDQREERFEFLIRIMNKVIPLEIRIPHGVGTNSFVAHGLVWLEHTRRQSMVAENNTSICDV